MTEEVDEENNRYLRRELGRLYIKYYGTYSLSSEERSELLSKIEVLCDKLET